MKNIENDYDEIFSDPRCKFFGNVTIGQDLSISDLSHLYSGIIYAYGASHERTLSIPGSSHLLPQSHLVSWYNGSLSCSASSIPPMSGPVVLIGNGNVAMDITRLLLKSRSQLEKESDMPMYAVDVLGDSQVNMVQVVARRGIV